MTLVILDPNLDRNTGHHLEWDSAIARAALARGIPCVVYAHRDCQIGLIEGIPIIPWFSATCYERRDSHPVTGSFDDICHFNDMLAAELAALPSDLPGPGDCVLAPTVSERHLLGYVSWLKEMDPRCAPAAILCLMFPSGLSDDSGGEALRIGDPIQALGYALALRRAADPGPPVHLLAGGRQLAREYSALAGRRIESHPLPVVPTAPVTRPRRDRPAALLFAGDAKMDKGLALLPELVERLASAWPSWDFLAHAHAGAATEEAKAAVEALRQVAERHANVTLIIGRLDRPAYEALFIASDLVLCPYDPRIYARKSSGVVWEAISLGIPLVVPGGTWLAREAAEWGAGCVIYASQDVDSILAAFGVAAGQIGDLSSRAAATAPAFRAQNGSEALLDLVGALWLPRFAAAALTQEATARTIPLEELQIRGEKPPAMESGMTVRRSGRVFDLDLAWPHASPASLQFDLARWPGERALSGARAAIAGAELPVRAVVASDGRGGSLLIGGLPPRSAQRLRVELPVERTRDGEAAAQDQDGLEITAITLFPGSMDDVAATVLLLEPVTSWPRPPQGPGFLVDGVLTGRALLAFGQDAPARLTLRAADPVMARGIRLAVNGRPVRLDFCLDPDGTWHASGVCVASVVDAERPASFDLWSEAESTPGPLLLGMRLGLCQLPDILPAPMAPPEAPAVTRRAARLVGMPSGDAVLSVMSDYGMVEARALRLDEIYAGTAAYSHLDMSIFGLRLGNVVWEHVKFKLCREGETAHLEFRRIADWPEVFESWSGEERDLYGPVLRIGPQARWSLGPHNSVRDMELLWAIVSLLPEATRYLLEAEGQTEINLASWQAAAMLIRHFLRTEIPLRGYTEGEGLVRAMTTPRD